MFTRNRKPVYGGIEGKEDDNIGKPTLIATSINKDFMKTLPSVEQAQLELDGLKQCDSPNRQNTAGGSMVPDVLLTRATATEQPKYRPLSELSPRTTSSQLSNHFQHEFHDSHKELPELPLFAGKQKPLQLSSASDYQSRHTRSISYSEPLSESAPTLRPSPPLEPLSDRIQALHPSPPVERHLREPWQGASGLSAQLTPIHDVPISTTTSRASTPTRSTERASYFPYRPHGGLPTPESTEQLAPKRPPPSLADSPATPKYSKASKLRDGEMLQRPPTFMTPVSAPSQARRSSLPCPSSPAYESNHPTSRFSGDTQADSTMNPATPATFTTFDTWSSPTHASPLGHKNVDLASTNRFSSSTQTTDTTIENSPPYQPRPGALARLLDWPSVVSAESHISSYRNALQPLYRPQIPPRSDRRSDSGSVDLRSAFHTEPLHTAHGQWESDYLPSVPATLVEQNLHYMPTLPVLRKQVRSQHVPSLPLARVQQPSHYVPRLPTEQEPQRSYRKQSLPEAEEQQNRMSYVPALNEQPKLLRKPFVLPVREQQQARYLPSSAIKEVQKMPPPPTPREQEQAPTILPVPQAREQQPPHYMPPPPTTREFQRLPPLPAQQEQGQVYATLPFPLAREEEQPHYMLPPSITQSQDESHFMLSVSIPRNQQESHYLPPWLPSQEQRQSDRYRPQPPPIQDQHVLTRTRPTRAPAIDNTTPPTTTYTPPTITSAPPVLPDVPGSNAWPTFSASDILPPESPTAPPAEPRNPPRPALFGRPLPPEFQHPHHNNTSPTTTATASFKTPPPAASILTRPRHRHTTPPPSPSSKPLPSPPSTPKSTTTTPKNMPTPSSLELELASLTRQRASLEQRIQALRNATVVGGDGESTGLVDVEGKAKRQKRKEEVERLERELEDVRAREQEVGVGVWRRARRGGEGLWVRR